MENKLEFIENYQLMYHKYDIEPLEYNIDRLSLRKLLVTQKLTPEFCKLYLLNPEEHAMCIEDHYISIQDILIYQKHIKKEDLINYN
jgi:hypothetical protein